ncbi:hypothetical protein RchiOBHm_Chr4g0436271 [Rosa chinensis]|uniref:Uncharacterized protein n=1 Tax=Rosa chinensis TaxID=74649 RepID=A0A2P6R200_ROSCH|nr:hypothetical protein RchiOBHm_Chr4g0436271 [Rosa chinensis]
MFSPSLLTLIYSIFSNFTLLSLPYINTFSSHSKKHSFIHFISLSHHFLSIFLSFHFPTHSFIHSIFFVSPFPFHFLSKFLHPSHLLCLSISFPFSLHPLVHSTFQAREKKKKKEP